MSTPAAIYTRISKDLQHAGLGVARQLADCQRYAGEHGYEVVAELQDNDISASGLKLRPSYVELRQLMEDRVVEFVLVYSMDRLHRNMAELIEYIELARRTDVGIISVSSGGRVNLATSDGRFQAHIFGAVAANEREKNQERIKRKHLELAQNGAWPGRRVYGHLEDATVVDAEANVIRELSDRILNGERYNDIARDLNTRGIPTLTGAQWRASSIVGIARSARIAGHREHHGVISARDSWAAIIDDETSMLLRSKLAPGRSGSVRGGPRKHLLTGLLRCGKCGSGLVRGLAGKAKVPNYRCPKNEGAAACGSISINLKSTEEFLSEALFVAHDRATTEVDKGDDALAAWAGKRAELEARKNKLAELVGAGAMDAEEWIVASGAVKKDLADLPEPRVMPHRTRITGDELRATWPQLSPAAKRTLLEDAFVKVTVLPRLIVSGAKLFDPRRLAPEWRH
jgi:site-specific DNA recombinase